MEKSESYLFAAMRLPSAAARLRDDDRRPVEAGAAVAGIERVHGDGAGNRAGRG